MSLERACVNCERCYNLADQRANENDIYAARNEAMKSLEETMIEYYKRAKVFGQPQEEDITRIRIRPDNITAIHALKACRTCDYSTPKIVETIEGKKE